MHNVIRRGMVLRVQAPYHKKVIIFDELQGKISAIPQAPAAPLVHGHLISYRLEQGKHCAFLCDIQIMKLPAAWVYDDILFLHHLLEMARFFLPEQSCAASVFRLCMVLYEEADTTAECTLLKKLFLGKFFALLGIYPDHALHDARELFHLFAGSQAPFLPASVIEDADELHKKLRQWLLGCIQTHPHANTFTTMQFLYAQDE